MISETERESLRIGDLVEVPEIRTVIQLEDLNSPGLRRMIVETFVLTGEVKSHLEAIFSSLTGGEGRGVFLKGNFGSGKSHFLSMLSQILRNPETWRILCAQDRAFARFEEKLRALRFLPVEISLVQHRGSEFLEDIVLRRILGRLGTEAFNELEGAETRHETFLKLKHILKEKGFAGICLLVDELSEFLRSKTDARAYNEDIRFLQYLGEEASGFPMWIVASLQEWIEETGEIHQDTFNKIKDRYRIRLTLGRAHMEELISERLIRHKEEGESRIGDLFDELKSYFPSFPATRERFIKLYPVHPATSTLLDQLKPLFSEHRGVVDFIHFRLRGDPERHIPCWLDQPVHRLLGPEFIFDHFLERIRERSETQVYVQRVFEAYREEIPEIFHDREQQRIALVLVKLLILLAISPVKHKYTVRHMAEMLLFRITPLETEINYRYVYDILERLTKEGSYIRVESRTEPLDNHYYIDLKADIRGIIRRQIRHTASQLFPEDRRLFTKLAGLVKSPYLPLGSWVEKGRQPLTVQWEHTPRTGVLLLYQLDQFSGNEVEGLARQWGRSEEDYFILVGTTHNRDAQYRHVKENLLPMIRERYHDLFLFWIPEALEGDPGWMKEILAALLMLEAMSDKSSEKSDETRGFLQSFIGKEEKRLTEHFTRCYFQGVLLWDENQVDLSRFGLLSQEKFLSEFVHPLLGRRFPRHARIQPFMDAPAPGILKDMLRDFLSTGVLVVEDHSKFGIRSVLEGLLKPMGLVKKRGNQYVLQVNPVQNELARQVLEEMGKRDTVALEEIYWAVRKGEYGLLMPQFEILVLALLFSGHLIAYRGTNRKGLDDLLRTGLKGITTLGRGEILGEDLRRAIEEHPLVPEKFRRVPATLALQEELWAEIKSRKLEAVEDLKALRSRIQWASSFQAFKNMPWQRVLDAVDSLLSQWEEVKVSFPSREGLERFIRAGDELSSIKEKIRIVEECGVFLNHAERFLFVYQYVSDPNFQIPELEAYGHLRRSRAEIIEYYEQAPGTFSRGAWESLLQEFQRLQEAYARVYVDAHNRARAGAQFEPYERLTRSERYRLLHRLDQLEMISPEHNRRSIDQALSAVLLRRCSRSPQDQLQAQPVCACGFHLGETVSLPPLRELEEALSLGIIETLEALKTAAIQEKIVPYVEGLYSVGKKNEAEAVRELLGLSTRDEQFFDQVNRILTPGVIQSINEAFRGKVLVVKRDLDQLYRNLVHRKYTLAQARKIMLDWLGEDRVSEDTFLHFLGGEGKDSSDPMRREFDGFLEEASSPLIPFYREIGHRAMVKGIIASLWAKQYDVPSQKIVEILPFLDRGGERENERWLHHLVDLARILRSRKPQLFERLILQVEEDASLIQALWSSISSASPREVFERESILAPVIKEAFERLLCREPEKLEPGQWASAEIEEPGVPSLFVERKKEMVAGLEALRRFKEKVSALNPPGEVGPAAFSRWESVFLHHLSPIPSLREALRQTLERIGTEIPPFVRMQERAVKEKMGEVTQAFVEFYHRSLPAWESGEGPRPMMIEDIPFILTKKRGVPDHRRVSYLLMDGMRWDLWEVIKTEFFGKKANLFRVEREGCLWANQPTETAAHLARLEAAFQSLDLSVSDEELFFKATGIDEKIHTEKGPLTHLFANVITYLEIDLLFRLRKLPARTLLVLFADHGFVENPAFNPREKYESPRYIHGKDSPFEVIVPWAWVMKL